MLSTIKLRSALAGSRSVRIDTSGFSSRMVAELIRKMLKAGIKSPARTIVVMVPPLSYGPWSL
jgi:hypothetical protein